MTIIQIADTHRRTPGSISYTLRNMGIIPLTNLARGYLEYKDSSLYKEISQECKKLRAEKKKLAEEKVKVQQKVLVAREQAVDLDALRKDVDTMKKDVREILRLMNALYDFETQ